MSISHNSAKELECLKMEMNVNIKNSNKNSLQSNASTNIYV